MCRHAKNALCLRTLQADGSCSTRPIDFSVTKTFQSAKVCLEPCSSNHIEIEALHATKEFRSKCRVFSAVHVATPEKNNSHSYMCYVTNVKQSLWSCLIHDVDCLGH